MRQTKLAILLLPLLLSSACATRPCKKNELLGMGVFGLKFNTDNVPIKEKGPDGNYFSYSFTAVDKMGIMLSIPSAVETPAPTVALVQNDKTIPLRPYCGGWHTYNPYGHTWHAGVIVPKIPEGQYSYCVSFPVAGKAEPITDCSTQLFVDQRPGEQDKVRRERLKGQKRK